MAPMLVLPLGSWISRWLSFASDMGPPERWFCQRHGTTLIASHGTT
jgi:hypothetical protein